MKKYILDLKVVENEHIGNNYILMKLTTSDSQLLPDMNPGQVVDIKVENTTNTFLRRSISIHFVVRVFNLPWLLIQ